MFRDFPDDFRYVLGLHEAVVVRMADGHAQATGNAAVVNLHSAAGVGNAMGNLFTAFKNRTPLIVTAGQQARAILPFDREVEHEARAQDVPAAIARAYRIAMQEPRGPVFVSIPVDDWDQPAELLPRRDVSRVVRPDPDARAARRCARRRAASRVRGRGSRRSRRCVGRRRAARRAAPCARVRRADVGRCSFPEDHPLFAGFLPAIREIVARLDGHDLVFAFGAPAFTYHIEGFGPHVPPGATLVQLVDDPGLAAWTPSGDAVVGNLRLAARPARAPGAAERPMPRRAAACARRTAGRRRAHVGRVRAADARRRARRARHRRRGSAERAARNAGTPAVHAQRHVLRWTAAAGYGMPAAVGVALAQPGRRVIGLIGDGSSLYSIQALWSAAQLKLPITFVILNNRRYAALQDFAPVFGFGPDDPVQGTDLPNLDFVALAQGMAAGAYACPMRRTCVTR